MQALGYVDQAQNVLLEARTSKTGSGSEHTRAQSSIQTTDMGNLFNTRSSLFTNCAKRVDATDPLRQECIRC